MSCCNPSRAASHGAGDARRWLPVSTCCRCCTTAWLAAPLGLQHGMHGMAWLGRQHGCQQHVEHASKAFTRRGHRRTHPPDHPCRPHAELLGLYSCGLVCLLYLLCLICLLFWLLLICLMCSCGPPGHTTAVTHVRIVATHFATAPIANTCRADEQVSRGDTRGLGSSEAAVLGVAQTCCGEAHVLRGDARGGSSCAGVR